MGALLSIFETYKWIIITAVLVIMFIVGFVADKTDFGRKTDEKCKFSKPVKNPNKVEEETVEKIDKINELGDDASIPLVGGTKLQDEFPIPDDFMTPSEDILKVKEDTTFEPSTEVLKAPEEVNEPKEVLVESIEPAGFVKVEPTDTTYEEKLVPEFIAEKFSKDDKEVSSEDDIWNF